MKHSLNFYSLHLYVCYGVVEKKLWSCLKWAKEKIMVEQHKWKKEIRGRLEIRTGRLKLEITETLIQLQWLRNSRWSRNIYYIKDHELGERSVTETTGIQGIVKEGRQVWGLTGYVKHKMNLSKEHSEVFSLGMKVVLNSKTVRGKNDHLIFAMQNMIYRQPATADGELIKTVET